MDWSTTTRFELERGVHILGDVDESSLLRRGRSYSRLAGPSRALLNALQTPRSFGSLLAPANASLHNAELRWRLKQLVAAGYVRATAVASDDGTVDGAGVDAGSTAAPPAALASPAVERHDLLEGTVRAALASTGAAGVQPILLDHYLAPRGLEALLERTAPRGNARWLPLSVFDDEVWLGPLIGLPEGPCPQCLLTRLWHNHPIERLLAVRGVAREQLFPALAPSAAVLDRAATWLRRRLPALLSTGAQDTSALQRVDFASRRESSHSVQRRPQCPRCGDATLVARQMLTPPSWRKTAPVTGASASAAESRIASRDGGLRTVDPELTYRRVSAQVDPLVGRVGSLGQDLEKSNTHHQAFSAAYHRVPQLRTDLEMQDFSVLAGGKGRSPVQARISALCEALERQCAQQEGDEAHRSASYRELAPDAMDPRELLLFSTAQYQAGTPPQQRRIKSPRSQQVPAPFDVEQTLEWSPVWSLAEPRLRWVPKQYCLDVTDPSARSQPACCAWDSNGCAAGNTLAEAALQGLLELVERDAVAIWWYNRLAMPALSFEGTSATVQRLVERHERLGRRCWALDLTHDLRIPVAAVLLEEPRDGGLALGFGCHVVPEMALERAVLELEQVLDGQDQSPRLFQRAELEQDRYLLPDTDRAAAPRLTGAELSAGHPGDGEIESTLAACVASLCASGLEPLLFDYSRPDVALHTVKMIVPGLRHFWPRYAPGRLYQVPVQMGWSRAPLNEEQLNPVPLLM